MFSEPSAAEQCCKNIFASSSSNCWNTWFEAAQFHAETLDHYISVVEEEVKNADTQQLRKLSALLHREQVNELRAELELTAVHRERLIKTLNMLEAREFKTVKIHKMGDLLSWLHNPGLLYATPSCEEAMTNAATKLAEYLQGTKQPALQLFKAVRVFDPKQLPFAITCF